MNLSGGEQKRLALARAIYAAADSSILLLDEPTSNVDQYNEDRIYSALFSGFPEACIVCTVHGLHLLPRFDRVLVLEHGAIRPFNPCGPTAGELI